MTEAEDRFLGSGRRPASFSLVTARAVHNATDDFHDHRPRSTRRRALFASPNTKDKQHHRYRTAFIPRFSLSLSLFRSPQYHPLSALPGMDRGGRVPRARSSNLFPLLPLFICNLCKLTRSPQPVLHASPYFFSTR